MGTEFIYVMATLKNPYMQLAMERAGYQLLGFTPGYDRELVEGNPPRQSGPSRQVSATEESGTLVQPLAGLGDRLVI